MSLHRTRELPPRWGPTLAAFQGYERMCDSEGATPGMTSDPQVWAILAMLAFAFVLALAQGDRVASERRTRLLIDRLDDDRLPSDTDRDGQLKLLRERDPAFDADALRQRTRRIVCAVEEAWTRGDLAGVRPLLSDGSYQRLVTQLALARTFGVRRVVADLEAREVRLSAMEIAGHFEAAHMGIRARGRLRFVPSALGDDKALEAAREADAQNFDSIWSFIRRRGTPTRTAGIAEGRCPNCGAAFKSGATGRCEFCEAVVNSGDYDWVVAKTSHVGEFSVTGYAAPGLAEVRQRDGDLAVQVIEDRAALLFWRFTEAMVLENPTRLRKVASDALVRRVEGRIADFRSHSLREWYHDVSLNGVDLLSIDVDENGRDYANVRLRWSGSRVVSGRGAPKLDTVRNRVEMIVMTRNVGALTDKVAGALTYRCWRCHGPLGDSDSTICDYCAAEQVDGAHHWHMTSFQSYQRWLSQRPARLERLEHVHARAARTFPVQFRSERQRLLRLMVAMAAADGVVDSRETRLLYGQARRWGIGPDELEGYLRSPEVEEEDLPTAGEGPAFIAGLVEVALADGRVDSAERKLLEMVADSLRLPRTALDDAIRRQTQPGAGSR